MNYTLETRGDDDQWHFVAEYTDYASAIHEIESWINIVGRVRRGNELIFTNSYTREFNLPDPLTEWRKKHIR